MTRENPLEWRWPTVPNPQKSRFYQDCDSNGLKPARRLSSSPRLQNSLTARRNYSTEELVDILKTQGDDEQLAKLLDSSRPDRELIHLKWVFLRYNKSIKTEDHTPLPPLSTTALQIHAEDVSRIVNPSNDPAESDFVAVCGLTNRKVASAMLIFR